MWISHLPPMRQAKKNRLSMVRQNMQEVTMVEVVVKVFDEEMTDGVLRKLYKELI